MVQINYLAGGFDPVKKGAEDPYLGAFKRGLERNRLNPGDVVAYYAAGKPQTYPELLRASARADVIVVADTAIARAARNMMDTGETLPPIVMVFSGTPDKAPDDRKPLIQTYDHPGSGITGLAMVEDGLVRRQLDYLFQLAPHTARLLALVYNDQWAATNQVDEVTSEAREFRKLTVPIRVKSGDTPGDLIRASAQPGDALLVVAHPYFAYHRNSILQAAAAHRLPGMYPTIPFVQYGGLASYGPDLLKLCDRTADIVAQIVTDHQPPAEIPVQRIGPDDFDLAINVTTFDRLKEKTLRLDALPSFDRQPIKYENRRDGDRLLPGTRVH